MKGLKNNDQVAIRKKYDFYRSIGYSTHASRVLSVLSYGGRELASFVNSIPQEDILEQIYVKFFKQDASPLDALNRYYYQNRFERHSDAYICESFSTKSSRSGSVMASREEVFDEEDDEETVIEFSTEENDIAFSTAPSPEAMQRFSARPAYAVAKKVLCSEAPSLWDRTSSLRCLAQQAKRSMQRRPASRNWLPGSEPSLSWIRFRSPPIPEERRVG